MTAVDALNDEIVTCRLCPRLVAWREEVAAKEKRAHRWRDLLGTPASLLWRPPGRSNDPWPRARRPRRESNHRMFCRRPERRLALPRPLQSRSGEPAKLDAPWGRPRPIGSRHSRHRTLRAAEQPAPEEVATCSRYLVRLLETRPWRSILCLGGIAWVHLHRQLGLRRSAFGHLAMHRVEGGPLIVASYHPSQQNTATGRLTEAMLDEAMARFLEKR